ncbi:MAG: riboflavin synthase [Deltaproteobacteria bacterium]|nr:riboflavin synthase [Deltaproteobacteria bacterium]
MFTGLIIDRGKITGRRALPGGETAGVVLTVQTKLDTGDFELGESIAVSGTCLTVTKIHRDGFEADVSRESLNKTKLGSVAVGSEVNLERALRAADRLGGHIVQGHVDGVGELLSAEPVGESHKLTFRVPDTIAPYLIPKGSVAVDGVSLTVNEVQGAEFTVNIIPVTWSETALGTLKKGDPVNLEADVLAKYVERLLAVRLGPAVAGKAGGSKIDLRFLAEHGFLE